MYTDDEIARMTPWQREEAQVTLIREALDRRTARGRHRYMKRIGRLGGLAKAANQEKGDRDGE